MGAAKTPDESRIAERVGITKLVLVNVGRRIVVVYVGWATVRRWSDLQEILGLGVTSGGKRRALAAGTIRTGIGKFDWREEARVAF